MKLLTDDELERVIFEAANSLPVDVLPLFTRMAQQARSYGMIVRKAGVPPAPLPPVDPKLKEPSF